MTSLTGIVKADSFYIQLNLLSYKSDNVTILWNDV